MTIPPPTSAELTALVGDKLCRVWLVLCAAIDARYDMERQWNSGGKRWTYEYKYRRGGKTLCALYAKEDCIGLMVIFGRDERATFEQRQAAFPAEIRQAYEDATCYHAGKWVMFTPRDDSLTADYLRVLEIKRKPNRKSAQG